MGGVASHAKGYTSINELWPAFGFHAACMAPGIYLLGKSRAKKTDA